MADTTISYRDDVPVVTEEVVSVAAASDGIIEPITLEEAKLQLREVLPDEDDYVLSLITVARQMAEGRLNRTLVRRQINRVFEGKVGDYRLFKPPFVSLDSVTLTDAYGAVVGEDSSYRVVMSGEIPILFPGYGLTWNPALAQGGSLAVTYTVGYAPGEVPAPIVQWMKLVIGTLYNNRETMSPGAQMFSMPDEFFKWLLQPYMVYE